MTPLAIASPSACSVAMKVGKRSGLSSLRAYSSHKTARSTSRAVFRNPALPEIRSQAVSGFTTTTGAACAWSAIDDLLDLFGEEHLVDPLREPLLILSGALHLPLHLPWMRGEQQDAVPHQHRFRNGMGDEKHREAGVLPEPEKLLLHLAAGERGERGGRLLPETGGGGRRP